MVQHYFYPERAERGREREKKNFSPEFCSYSTRARKFGKKIEKAIKKPISSIIFRQNRMRQAKKEKKKNLFRIPFTHDQGKKIPKKVPKKFKKLKNPFPALFFDKTG